MRKLSTATENGTTKIRVYDSLRDIVGGKPAVEMSEDEAARALLAHAGLLDACYAGLGALVTVREQHPWTGEVIDSIKAALRAADPSLADRRFLESEGSATAD